MGRKLVLLSWMQPGQDFLRQRIIFLTPGMLNAENLWDISTMTQLFVCVLHDKIGQDGFPAHQWYSNGRMEISVGDKVDSVLRLNKQVFQFFLGLQCRIWQMG